MTLQISIYEDMREQEEASLENHLLFFLLTVLLLYFKDVLLILYSLLL